MLAEPVHTIMRSEGRNYFRLRYPNHLCPHLAISGESLSVIDISEKGLRFSCLSNSRHVVGTAMTATVVFRSGQAAAIEGVILRVTKLDVALRLQRGFNFKTIVHEQRALLGKVKYAFH
jgi:hypothetical protein